MKSFSFSACFLFLSLLDTLVFLKDPMYFGKIPNKWAQLYLLKLRLNICIDNDSSRASSNSSTCNILSSSTVLIRVGIVTEAFSLTEMIWFRLHSSWITVDREVGQNWNFIKITWFLHHLKALNERIWEWAHFVNLDKRFRRYLNFSAPKNGVFLDKA